MDRRWALCAALACAAWGIASAQPARDAAPARALDERGTRVELAAPTDEQLAMLVSDEPVPAPAPLPQRAEAPASSDAPRRRLSEALLMGDPTIIRVTRIEDRHSRGVWILGEVLASATSRAQPGAERAFRAAGGVQCTSQELLEVGATLFMVVRDGVIDDESVVPTSALVFTSMNGPLARAMPRGADWTVAFGWGEASYRELVAERSIALNAPGSRRQR